jgi:hypothetical protein
MRDDIIIYRISYNIGYDEFLVKVELNGLIIRCLTGNRSAACITNVGLIVDESLMRSRYNIGFSAYEIISFVANKYIYSDFIVTPFSRCVVLDESAGMQYDRQSLLKECSDLDGDCDIYFPFDRTQHNSNENWELYILGHVWGLDMYFLTKKGAGILQELKVIKQPLDEEMLELSMDNTLNIYFSNDTDYTYEENEMRQISRNQAVKQAILAMNNWEAEDKVQIRLLLKKVSRIAKEANVNLILGYGSLLGHVRHGGIMPWDDDVDLLILNEDVEELLSALGKEEIICFRADSWKHISYYKIWFKSGKKIPFYDYTFPFIDIWIVKCNSGNIITEEGVQMPVDEFYPLQTATFENADFYIPADPIKCLNAFYQNWQSEITVFPWNHQEEEPSNFPLSAKITVNDHGRMIS